MTTINQLDQRVTDLESAIFRLTSQLSRTHLLADGSHNEDDADAKSATDYYVKEIHKVQGEQGDTLRYIQERVLRINHSVIKIEEMVTKLAEAR